MEGVQTREEPSSRTKWFAHCFSHFCRRCAVLGAVVMLAACGGGGGGSGSSPPDSSEGKPPTNQPPQVEAGDDQATQLPAATITLQGSATDPEGAALTYSWTVSPSEGVTIAAPTAAETEVTFTTPGEYTFTLTVSDGAASASDSLVVVVLPPASSELYWPGLDLDENDPDRGWIRVAPEEVGMNAALLEQAAQYALTAGGTGMVVKGGRLVYSWATGLNDEGNPASIDTRYPAQSATKSIGSMALGFALQDRLLSLNDRAVDRLAGFGRPPDTNNAEWIDQITILHLATHTAGFEKSRSDPALLFEPGTTWNYSDGALNWLADILTAAFNQDLHEVLTNRVWSLLGMNLPRGGDDVQWRPNASRAQTLNGIATRELSSGLVINANAMARVGLLFLRNGMWSTGRILPEEFIELVRTPRPEFESAQIADPDNFPNATTDYGVLWWTNANGHMANVPRDAFWAWGQYDVLLVVIPSLDLVIVRTGPEQPDSPGRVFGDAGWNADYRVLEPFLEPIVCAADPTSSACAAE